MSFKGSWKPFAAAALAAGTLFALLEYKAFMAVPTSRLADGALFPEMPPDARHHYLRLPVDHSDPAKGSFTGFYLLSSGFRPGAATLFFLTDAQQELVSPSAHLGFFDSRLGRQQYVLIGVRGHAHALFPEVFRADGAPDYAAATRLYGSAQLVEDIEAVRLDMLRKKLLAGDGRIMIAGASGGGVLAQQYVAEHGAHVSRVLLESTGAMDVALKHKAPFAKGLLEYDPALAEAFSSLGGDRAAFAFALFKLAQQRLDAGPLMLSMARGMQGKSLTGRLRYLKLRLNPMYDLALVRFLLSPPSELAVRVRMYELTGADLRGYTGGDAGGVNLMYEWCRGVLADFLAADPDGRLLPRPVIDRGSFKGEVLVLSGTRDHAFSQSAGRWIAEEFPRAAFASFEDKHRLERYPEYYRTVREEFFGGGLSSTALRRLLADERQLNQPSAPTAALTKEGGR